MYIVYCMDIAETKVIEKRKGNKISNTQKSILKKKKGNRISNTLNH